MKKISFLIIMMMSVHGLCLAQDWTDYDTSEKLHISDGLQYQVELQATASNNQTPLWLNANKYGLSSLKSTNGYLRGAVIRPLKTDSICRWGIGFGLDMAVPVNYTSKVVVQQAFAEIRWLHGTLSIGSKEYPMELKNNTLSSGSQTLGINARPVPQVRLSLPDYWRLPFGKGWLHLKGHIAYGKFTDDNWQHDFTDRKNKYADNVLYHSKAGFLKIGNAERFKPWSLELGVEMASTFGGTAHRRVGSEMQEVKNNTDLKAFFHAFIPGGGDVVEEGTVYQNEEGNHLGSWLARLNYEADRWQLSFYAEKYFEDHSSMFQLDYDGYGEGPEWNVRKKRRYFLYDFKDWLLGMEWHSKYSRLLNTVLFEYIYTKYQSGPVYHDHSEGRSDHISGIDSYYNHYIFTGWQHWGQVMGNPLYRSPIYNTDGTIEVKDNRFYAFHLGLDGSLSDDLSYRFLATCQKGFGTYYEPYHKSHHNVSLLLEGKYNFSSRMLQGWSLTGGLGMDFGAILGNTYGFQMTVAKTGSLLGKKGKR